MGTKAKRPSPKSAPPAAGKAASPRSSRTLLWRLGLAGAALLLLVVAWQVVGPAYNGSVAALASTVTPAPMRVVADDTHFVLEYDQGTAAKPFRARLNALAFDGGLLLVLAIVCATPGMSWRRRAAWAGGAVGVFALAHAVTLLLFALLYKGEVESGQLLLESMLPMVPLLYVALPALLLLAWFWRRWTPLFRDTRAER